MGRNLFLDTAVADSGYAGNHAFILDFDMRLIGLVSDKYYYAYHLQTKKEGVYPLRHNDPLPAGEPPPGELSLMRNITLGYYETARYLLFHNRKQQKK